MLFPHANGTPDSTDDLRPGMGYEGVAALRHFVERGGLLVAEGHSARLPVEMGFNPTVSVAATPRLVARGAVFRARAVDAAHPVLYGYEAGATPVYFNQAPVFAVQANETAAADARTRAVMQNVPDSAILREVEGQRARVVLRFDAAETQGSYAMVLNAMAHWNAFDVNRRGAGAAAGATPSAASPAEAMAGHAEH